ncbi:MAG: 3-oxoacyl-ACP reductase FabG [Clostridia bacterium]|nr:3-oxoacyl-ACP reductase FabG [Clostridia bacterium]
MKTILITGSSRGIGAEIARLAFLSGEYNVVINYNKSAAKAAALIKELEEVALQNPHIKYGGIIAAGADVSRETDVNLLFEAAEKAFGSIDVLVNNAAVSSYSLLQDLTLEQWHNTMGVNLDSVFLCAKRVLPSMIRKKSGRIINISSIWGICGSSCEVHYSASKAAVIGFTKALAKEVGPSGITVNCVAPGVIDTEMNKNLTEDSLTALCEETPLGCIGKCEDIAKTVLFLAGDGGNFITGQVISPNGGIVI